MSATPPQPEGREIKKPPRRHPASYYVKAWLKYWRNELGNVDDVPQMKWLAANSGVSEKTVSRCLKRLDKVELTINGQSSDVS